MEGSAGFDNLMIARRLLVYQERYEKSEQTHPLSLHHLKKISKKNRALLKNQMGLATG